MPEDAQNLLEVAIEIRELLKLIAEPAIAQRDEKLRTSLRQVVGKSQAKKKAVLLMDGSRSQIEIRQATSVDQGDLSKLVKSLREEGLLSAGDKPKLKLSLPVNFFEVVE